MPYLNSERSADEDLFDCFPPQTFPALGCERVCKHRLAPGVVDPGDDVGGCWSVLGHVIRGFCGQEIGECVRTARNDAGGDEGVGNMRTANRSTGRKLRFDVGPRDREIG